MFNLTNQQSLSLAKLHEWIADTLEDTIEWDKNGKEVKVSILSCIERCIPLLPLVD